MTEEHTAHFFIVWNGRTYTIYNLDNELEATWLGLGPTGLIFELKGYLAGTGHSPRNAFSQSRYP